MFTSGGQAVPSKYCRRQGSASQNGMPVKLAAAGGRAKRTTSVFDAGSTRWVSSALLVVERQRMDGKIRASVRPRGNRRPSRTARQRGEGFERVFVAVLGVDGLARTEFNEPARDPRLLPLLAGEVHFDAMTLGIIEGVMAEAAKIEVGAQLTVDPRQQIEIEPGGHAGGVVVGGVEDTRVLHQVDPDDQMGAWSQHATGVPQEL